MDAVWVLFLVCVSVVMSPLIERAFFAGMDWLFEDPQPDSLVRSDKAAEAEVEAAELIYNLNRTLSRGQLT